MSFTERRSVTQTNGGTGWGEEEKLQTDAAQLFLSDPIPAKAKKLGLLSIFQFSLTHQF
jgi:hypothetical protein